MSALCPKDVRLLVDFGTAMCYAINARNERGFWQSRNKRNRRPPLGLGFG